MRPTAHLDDATLGFQVDPVVTVEGVSLQVPAIIFEKGGRPIALVTGREVEHRQRIISIFFPFIPPSLFIFSTASSVP